MRTKTYIIGVVVALAFCSCEKEQALPNDNESGFTWLYAEIAGQAEVTTRVEKDNTGTYVAFKKDDEIGLYTDDGYGNPGSLKTNNPMEDVKNLRFKLREDGKWQDDSNPLLKWDTNIISGDEAPPADIYGYFPYKEGDFTNGGYPITTDVTVTNKLKDVLVAERTTVQNNNPAIFLTFKHRFALLKIQLGTGLEGVLEGVDDLSVIMNAGIKTDAKIGKGTIDLQIDEDTGVKEFKPIHTHAGFYYIIVPVEKIPETVDDSLAVVSVKIKDAEPTEFSKPFIARKNTIYNVTVHKGEEGSVAVSMGGIEEWGSDRHFGNIRETGGLYWPSDVRNLVAALNALGRAPTNSEEDKAKLASWGSWSETDQCFIFPVMRNIDMTEYADPANRNYCINEFYGILDGKGHYINGLDIKGQGFIGTVKEGSEIKDLELKNVSVDNGASNAGTGALAGTVEGGAVIHNCSATGTSVVKGGDNTGGLIGTGNPVMDRCSSEADVTGGSNTGGLIGNQTGGSISQSYTVGTVTATGDNVGGLAGSAAGTITDSHAGCDVKGENNVGGLVGNATNDINKCTATGHIEGKNKVGGLVGSSSTTVKQCGSNGTVTGTGTTGGLIGEHVVNGDVVIEIKESYSQSSVAGGTTGGLIGNVTRQYVPEVPEVPAWTEEIRDEESGELIDTIEHPTIPAIPAKGTEIIDCYATTAGVALIANTSSGISYSYKVIVGSDEGSNDIIESDGLYTIPLKASPEAIDNIITELNHGRNPGLWVKGLVMIDGTAYMLPVLNYK